MGSTSVAGLTPAVFQRLDNAIQLITHYPMYNISKTNPAIHWIVISPVDSVIRLSNNSDQGEERH